jgi:hypothetical protein
MLAPDLFREEPAEMIRIQSEFLDYPLSVRSADVIRAVLVNSPDFNEDVKAWARTLSVQQPGELRNAIRAWWKVNKVAFEKKDLTAVRVATSVSTNRPSVGGALQ